MSENREHIYHAAMMDPHTSAELDLDQIWSLVDDLIAAHGDWLPRVGEGIGGAKSVQRVGDFKTLGAIFVTGADCRAAPFCSRGRRPAGGS